MGDKLWQLPRINLADGIRYARVLGGGPPFTVRVYTPNGELYAMLYGVNINGRHDPNAAATIQAALDVWEEEAHARV